MNTLGFLPAWQYDQNVANNPALVNMGFPEGMVQTTVQPVGPYYWSGLQGLGAFRRRARQADNCSWNVPCAQNPCCESYQGFRRGMQGLDGALPTKVYGALALLSSVAMAFHGIKRNHGSIGWGLWWGLMGGVFPLFTPIVAVAQKPGFAKPK